MTRSRQASGYERRTLAACEPGRMQKSPNAELVSKLQIPAKEREKCAIADEAMVFADSSF
jgi:hypothetical protein